MHKYDLRGRNFSSKKTLDLCAIRSYNKNREGNKFARKMQIYFCAGAAHVGAGRTESGRQAGITGVACPPKN